MRIFIFGANCEESSSVVKRFVQLCQEIADSQGKIFDIGVSKFLLNSNNY